GTGILGVWNRSAGTLAMAAATLSALSGGRFILGLGASTPQLTEGLHDVPFTTPVAQMRRIVTQVRALLRGERIPLERVTTARPCHARPRSQPTGPPGPRRPHHPRPAGGRLRPSGRRARRRLAAVPLPTLASHGGPHAACRGCRAPPGRDGRADRDAVRPDGR